MATRPRRSKPPPLDFMKHCISIAWILLLVCNALAAPTNMSLTVSTNWVLQHGHTNFFKANSNALNAAVNTNIAWNATVHSAAGSATNLTASGWLLVDAAQTNTGALTVAGPYVIPATGSITGPVVISNAANVWDGGTVSATVGRLTNGVYVSPVLSSPLMTNGINYGNAFSSRGSGTNSEAFGQGATATNNGSLSIGYFSQANGIYASAFGSESSASGDFSSALGEAAASFEYASLALGAGASAEKPYSMAIGPASTASHTNSIAIGFNSSSSENNQMMLGSSTVDYVKTFGRLEAGGGITNAVLTGAVTNNASYSETRLDITTLAAGANSGINPGSAVNLKVSGPTNSFSIAGIAGGRDGRVISIQNSTGYPMTILNDSGLDNADTNRIYTGGADITLSNSPSVVSLKYDSSVSRWVLNGINALTAATGGDVTQAGNNTFTGTNSFSVPVIVAAPSATNHAATKAYVDSLTSSNNTFTGTNTFTQPLTLESNLHVGGDITFKRTPGITIDTSYPHFLKISSFASDLLYLPSRGPNGDAEIEVNDSGLLFVDATTNNVLCKINPEALTAGGLSTYSASVKIVRVDSSTNTVTVENSLKDFGLTIDGLPSVEIKPLCGAEFVPLVVGGDLDLKSSLNNSMCLPTWLDERVSGTLLGLSVATPKKADAYPGSPYKVPLFDAGEAADFTLTTTRRLAVTNVWFPKLTYTPALLVKLTAASTAGQTNVTFALRYRIATQGGTFGSLLSTTNTLTLESTNTLYRLDFGSVTNNALSGVSGAVIEGGLERLTGGDGDITDDVVTVESLLFTMPFEVPLGSQNRTGD